MALLDLRRFMARLSEAGELRQIDAEVDPSLQAGALCAHANEIGAEAIHCVNVRGYPDWSLAGGLLAGPGLLYPRERKPWTRMATALGIDPAEGWEEFIATFLTRRSAPIKPMVVGGGPCQEKVIQRDDVDLSRIPFPVIHGTDAGVYSNAHVMVARDPDTGAAHWGRYRCQVTGERTLVAAVPGDSPLAQIQQKRAARGESVPVSLCYGGDPALLIAATLDLPLGADEAGVAGGLGLDPIVLTRALTSDVLVPADAELVIEGEIRPGDTGTEGPFTTFNGVTPAGPGLVVHVNAVTHREAPILPFMVEGIRFGDALTLASIIHSADLTMFCRLAGVPVRWVMCPAEARMALCIVSTRVPFNGYLWQLAKYLFSWSNWFDKIVFVDYFVNPDEHIQCYNDMINKANPTKSWRRSDLDAPVPLSAKYPTPEGVSARMHINATWDPKWPKEWLALKVSFEDNFPEPIQQRVLERWTDLGFEEKPVVVTRPA